MSEPKRIFVSHSSKDDAAANAFLEKILAAIRGAKNDDGDPAFLALVDRDLPKGDEWRPILYNWMLLCDAAIILLDPDSTSSLWVPREAMVFHWRQQIDPAFRVIPVLRGVTKSIFGERAFLEIGLGELTYAEATDLAGIVAALKEVQSSCDFRLDEVEAALSVAPVNPNRFHKARPLLGLNSYQFLTTLRPERAVAAGLLSFGFREGPFGSEYHPGAQALGTLDWLQEDKLKKIFGTLTPYWVDRAAAANLYRPLRRAETIVLRVNLSEGDWPGRVVNAYVREACSQGKPAVYTLDRIVPLTRSLGLVDELKYARDALRMTLWSRMPDTNGEPTDADQASINNTYTKRKGNLYLWTHETDRIKLEHLVQLQRDEMPYVTIIYLSSTDAYSSFEGVHYVVPELDLQAEQTAAQELTTTITYFPKKYDLYQVV